MNKKKLILFGGLFLFGLALIVIGFLMDGKEEKVPGDDSLSAAPSKDNPFAANNKDTLPSRGKINGDIEDIYLVEESENEAGETITVLEHEGLKYILTIPSEDMAMMRVEETEKNNIISTAFYYDAEEIGAYVFSINNYDNFVWEDIVSTTPDTLLSKGPVRTLTYSTGGDIPFEEGTAAYRDYVYLIEQVPSYISGFETKKVEEQAE